MIRFFTILGLSLATVAAAAQQKSAPPAFDVASVRRSDVTPGEAYQSNIGVALPGGRWLALNTTLSRVVRTLYDVGPEQIVGAPPWFDRDLFVIDARAADPDTPPDRLSEMARQLLANRFGLRLHVEERPVDVSALVLARPDGKPGSGLRPTRCVPRPAEAAAASAADGRCGSFSRTVTNGLWRFRMNGHTLRTLVILHRVEAVHGGAVVDRTGLTGAFDIDLEYAPDPAAPEPPGRAVLTAIEQQLGLKIERRREPMNVLVIDSVELPTAN